jgi:hypothetical protein
MRKSVMASPSIATAPDQPAFRSLEPRRTGREDGVVEHGTRRASQDRKGVGCGVGIHADDKVVSAALFRLRNHFDFGSRIRVHVSNLGLLKVLVSSNL